LNGGLLGGVLRKEREGKRRLEGRAQKALEANRQAVEAYESFCDDLGSNPALVGLAWLLHQPAVTGPIIGPRTIDQLDSSLQALDVDLDEGALARLDEIFPGPGGPAPEAYAW
jgi:aryl-alcohol dehydrogenase-like predicted oxidoreductase